MKKSCKKWLSLILVISCILTCIPMMSFGASAADSSAANDLKGHWSEAIFRDMASWGVIGGDRIRESVVPNS